MVTRQTPEEYFAVSEPKTVQKTYAIREYYYPQNITVTIDDSVITRWILIGAVLIAIGVIIGACIMYAARR